MTVKSIAHEIALVDAFLAEPKLLYGSPPEFGEKRRGEKATRIWELIWPISDAMGVVAGGELRVNYTPTWNTASFSVIYLRQCIFRIDYDSAETTHNNPLWSMRFKGVEARVSGPHVHEWRLNRQHILETGNWKLECRVAIPDEIKDFRSAALPWLAQKINLTLGPSGRSLSFPRTLF